MESLKKMIGKSGNEDSRSNGLKNGNKESKSEKNSPCITPRWSPPPPCVGPMFAAQTQFTFSTDFESNEEKSKQLKESNECKEAYFESNESNSKLIESLIKFRNDNDSIISSICDIDCKNEIIKISFCESNDINNSGISLWKYISNNILKYSKMSEKWIAIIVSQIIEIVKKLHENKIVHLSINPNCFDIDNGKIRLTKLSPSAMYVDDKEIYKCEIDKLKKLWSLPVDLDLDSSNGGNNENDKNDNNDSKFVSLSGMFLKSIDIWQVGALCCVLMNGFIPQSFESVRYLNSLSLSGRQFLNLLLSAKYKDRYYNWKEIESQGWMIKIPAKNKDNGMDFEQFKKQLNQFGGSSNDDINGIKKGKKKKKFGNGTSNSDEWIDKLFESLYKEPCKNDSIVITSEDCLNYLQCLNKLQESCILTCHECNMELKARYEMHVINGTHVTDGTDGTDSMEKTKYISDQDRATTSTVESIDNLKMNSNNHNSTEIVSTLSQMTMASTKTSHTKSPIKKAIQSVQNGQNGQTVHVTRKQKAKKEKIVSRKGHNRNVTIIRKEKQRQREKEKTQEKGKAKGNGKAKNNKQRKRYSESDTQNMQLMFDDKRIKKSNSKNSMSNDLINNSVSSPIHCEFAKENATINHQRQLKIIRKEKEKENENENENTNDCVNSPIMRHRSKTNVDRLPAKIIRR